MRSCAMIDGTFRIYITFPSTRRATVLIEAMGTKGDNPGARHERPR